MLKIYFNFALIFYEFTRNGILKDCPIMEKADLITSKLNDVKIFHNGGPVEESSKKNRMKNK